MRDYYTSSGLETCKVAPITLPITILVTRHDDHDGDRINATYYTAEVELHGRRINLGARVTYSTARKAELAAMRAARAWARREMEAEQEAAR